MAVVPEDQPQPTLAIQGQEPVSYAVDTSTPFGSVLVGPSAPVGGPMEPFYQIHEPVLPSSNAEAMYEKMQHEAAQLRIQVSRPNKLATGSRL